MGHPAYQALTRLHADEDGQRRLGLPAHCPYPGPRPRSGVAVAVSTVQTMAVLTAMRSGADALVRLACADRWARQAAEELAAEVASAGGVDISLVRPELCARALADSRLPALPSRIAAEAIVRLLGMLPNIQGASVWIPAGTEGLVCVSSDGVETSETQAAADAALAGAGGEADGVVAVPVRRWMRLAAVVVLAVPTGGRKQAIDLGSDAAAVLALVLERDALLDRNQDRERELVESSERRLARLAFDIHDGPLQTVSALGLELGLLAGDDAPEAVERIRELHERVAALETELRELTHTLEPTSISRQPLAATLRRQAESFGRQHGLAVHLETTGDHGDLTPSQRIALVRVVHEALTNAHDHGGATEVRVTVSTDRHGVIARVTDNGCGFDVASALPAAARKGRLGLVGMSERMRLLGGHLDVESRAGGPTTITASVPHWSPLARAASGAQVSAIPIAASA
jgi:signal transduction histidine kinase